MKGLLPNDSFHAAPLMIPATVRGPECHQPRRQAFGIRLIHLAVLLPATMEGVDGNLLLAAKRFLIQIAAVAVAEQSNNLFWLVSLLLHFEDLFYSNPLTPCGSVF